MLSQRLSLLLFKNIQASILATTIPPKIRIPVDRLNKYFNKYFKGGRCNSKKPHTTTFG